MDFYEYTTLIIDDDRLSSNAKLVSFVLMQFYNKKNGDCYPSIRTLASKCCLSDKTIQNAIKQLQDFEYISVYKKKSKANNFNINYYKFIGVTVVMATTVDTTVDTTVNTTVTVTTKPIEPIEPIESNEVYSGNASQKIYQIGSSIFPKLATANSYEITKWLENGCDVEKDILPELNRHKGKDIGAWSYFTNAIAQAKSNRLKPMPEPPPKNSGGYKKQAVKFEQQNYRENTDGFITI